MVSELRPRFECSICFGECPDHVWLPCSHHFCRTCLETTFDLAATENDLSRLVCPDPDCKFSLASPDIMPLLKDILPKGSYTKVLDALSHRALQGTGFYSCPKCHTKGFVNNNAAVPRAASVQCNRCDFRFCSSCCSDLYHYNLPTDVSGKTCEFVMREKEAAWLSFSAETIGKLLEERAEYQKELQKFQKEQEERRKTLAAFETDEQAKANWVHCPHCNALWAGSDACPSVTCGVLEKTMGAKRGVVGCGKKFDLDKAVKYTPVRPPGLQEGALPLQQSGQHEVSHNIPCSKCSKNICGLRFCCLNCSSYNLCLSCLAKHGQAHEAEKKWPGRNHIFDIIREPRHHMGSSASEHAGLSEAEMLEIALCMSASEESLPKRSRTMGTIYIDD